MAAQARQHAAQARQCRHAVLSGWAESVLEMDPDLVRTQFGENGSWMDHARGNESAEKCLADQRAMAESLRRRLEETVSAGHEGQRLICCPFPDTLAGVRQLRRVLDLIGQTPVLEVSWLDARGNADSQLLDEAVRHRAAVRALSGELLRDWEPSALTLDAEGMLGRFKTEYVGLFHFFNAGYRQDMKMLRLHLKAVGGRLDDSGNYFTSDDPNSVWYDKGNANSNEVYISGGTVSGSVYGGAVLKNVTGNANSNKVEISGGEVKASRAGSGDTVYGGYSETSNYLKAGKSYMSHYLSFQQSTASSETVEALADSVEVRAMPCYPDDGSIRVVGGCIVVKLED